VGSGKEETWEAIWEQFIVRGKQIFQLAEVRKRQNPSWPGVVLTGV
jgi:hypothetical protein